LGDAPSDLAPIRGTDPTVNTSVFIWCRHPLALDMIPSNFLTQSQAQSLRPAHSEILERLHHLTFLTFVTQDFPEPPATRTTVQCSPQSGSLANTTAEVSRRRVARQRSHLSDHSLFRVQRYHLYVWPRARPAASRLCEVGGVCRPCCHRGGTPHPGAAHA
jgi:hypothetical protein